MRVLAAPDSFKGTFSAVDVAAALARGAQASGADVDRCPVADGGEGTLDVLAAQLGGRRVAVAAHDPLARPIRAEYAVLGDGRRAVVEMAAASGLGLLRADERDPWRATTRGTGELIVAAARAGAREILVAVGGSATVDGGQGALEAIAAAGGLGDARLVVLCDVETPWERCAEIFGPQKGARPEDVGRLAARLDALAAELPRDPRGVPGTGAAGGLSGGLWAALGAQLRPGAPFVLDAIGFDKRLASADAVVVGEGRIDAQSAMGKIVGAIGARAAAAGTPMHAIVGASAIGADAAAALGLRSIRAATTLEAIERAARELTRDLSAAAAA